MRGRKPRPAKVLELEGRRPRPAGRARAEPQGTGQPVQPGWLPPYAAEAWDQLVPELAAMGVLCVLDTAVIVGLCLSVSDVRQAREQIEDLTEPTADGGSKKNTLLRIARDAQLDVLRHAAELGCTPSGRARLGIQTARNEDGSRLKDLMFQKKEQ